MAQTAQCQAGDHQKCGGSVVTLRGVPKITVRNPDYDPKDRKPKKTIQKAVPADRREGPHDHLPCGCDHHARKDPAHKFPNKTVVLFDGKDATIVSHDKYDRNSKSWVCTVKVKKDKLTAYESKFKEKPSQ